MGFFIWKEIKTNENLNAFVFAYVSSKKLTKIFFFYLDDNRVKLVSQFENIELNTNSRFDESFFIHKSIAVTNSLMSHLLIIKILPI